MRPHLEKKRGGRKKGKKEDNQQGKYFWSSKKFMRRVAQIKLDRHSRDPHSFLINHRVRVSKQSSNRKLYNLEWKNGKKKGFSRDEIDKFSKLRKIIENEICEPDNTCIYVYISLYKL